MSSKCHICSYKGPSCLVLCCNELQVKSETAVVQYTDSWMLIDWHVYTCVVGIQC